MIKWDIRHNLGSDTLNAKPILKRERERERERERKKERKKEKDRQKEMAKKATKFLPHIN